MQCVAGKCSLRVYANIYKALPYVLKKRIPGVHRAIPFRKVLQEQTLTTQIIQNKKD